MAIVMYNGAAIEFTNQETKWQIIEKDFLLPNLNTNTFVVLPQEERVSVWL